MININYDSRNYRGFNILVLKQESRYGRNSTTSFIWSIDDWKNKKRHESNPFHCPEVAFKNAQYWIEEFLLKGKDE